jgi:hypothetical protein
MENCYQISGATTHALYLDVNKLYDVEFEVCTGEVMCVRENTGKTLNQSTKSHKCGINAWTIMEWMTKERNDNWPIPRATPNTISIPVDPETGNFPDETTLKEALQKLGFNICVSK